MPVFVLYPIYLHNPLAFHWIIRDLGVIQNGEHGFRKITVSALAPCLTILKTAWITNTLPDRFASTILSYLDFATVNTPFTRYFTDSPRLQHPLDEDAKKFKKYRYP